MISFFHNHRIEKLTWWKGKGILDSSTTQFASFYRNWRKLSWFSELEDRFKLTHPQKELSNTLVVSHRVKRIFFKFLTTSDHSMVIRLGFSNFFSSSSSSSFLHLCISGEEEGKYSKVDEYLITMLKRFLFFKNVLATL